MVVLVLIVCGTPFDSQTHVVDLTDSTIEAS